MKTRLGMLIFVFLTGLVLGGLQPDLLYAGAETTGTTLWDPFVNVSLFTGKSIPHPFHAKTNLPGRLSIVYSPSPGGVPCSDDTNPLATMFYTLRLSDGWRSENASFYTSFTPGICLSVDAIGIPGSGGQGDLILEFLKTVVLQIFPYARDAYVTYVKSDNNPWMAPDGLAFVIDITIVVKR